MDDLLTTKQVQDILQIDRTTIYRMLNDGRLTGIKVGSRWRFPRAEIEGLVSDAPATSPECTPQVSDTQLLPLHHIQPIQDIFAEMVGIGWDILSPEGKPLTAFSNCSRFCRLILDQTSGCQACRTAWAEIARQADLRPKIVTCHAGLSYGCVRIEVDDNVVGVIIAGQFYAGPPDATHQVRQILQLADDHDLDPDLLSDAAQELPLLNDDQQQRLIGWLKNLAKTLGQVGHDRAELMRRLNYIAELSSQPVD